MLKKNFSLFSLAFSNILFFSGCGGAGLPNSSFSASRTVDANTTKVSNIGGLCYYLTRDTTHCQATRTAIGLSGNWLNFSCNVTLGLADSAKNSTEIFSHASYVTASFTSIPDYGSHYFAQTGTYYFTGNDDTVGGFYKDLYDATLPTYPESHYITQKNITLYIPINPSQAGSTQTMGNGVVGVAVNGVPIYSSIASSTANVYYEHYSYDPCRGLPDSSGIYHYRSLPYSISNKISALSAGSNLIGVMLDGFFIYGPYDYGSTTDLTVTNTSSDLYIYGGHAGSVPTTGTGNIFHYHATKSYACFHRYSGYSVSDDGTLSTDNTTNPCTVADGGGNFGIPITEYFLTGHGNGGTFATIPTISNGSQVTNNTVGIRYYYGTPGTCSGC